MNAIAEPEKKEPVSRDDEAKVKLDKETVRIRVNLLDYSHLSEKELEAASRHTY